MNASTKQLDQSSATSPLELIADMCRGDLEAESKELEEALSRGRRKHYRKPVFMVVDYTTQGHAYRDFIQNISPDGAFIETPTSFRIGQELSLSFALPSCRKHIKITGQVVRTSPQGIGVKFDIAREHQEVADRKELVERRKHRRIHLQASAFAMLNRPFFEMAEIIDMSLGGVSFSYSAEKQIPEGSFALDILCVADGSYLRKMPVKTITDFEISKELRMHGAQFGRLTDRQSSQLRSFIEAHARGEVLPNLSRDGPR
jgi:Tfp pilus assembly protein PilZ